MKQLLATILPSFMLFMGLGLIHPPTEVQAAACDTQPVAALLEPDLNGKATFCVYPGGLRAKIRVKQLNEGDAYTVWWVYFDDPSLCAVPNACAEVDFGGANPLGVFGRMDSAVAPASGHVKFSGKVRGMLPSSGSQVWLLVFGHGAADVADGRHLARQLLTPEDPAAGAPHLGIVGGPLGSPAAIAVFNLP